MDAVTDPIITGVITSYNMKILPRKEFLNETKRLSSLCPFKTLEGC